MIKKKVAIVGLGYVGLPLACLCVKKGYSVIGIDIKKETIDKISKGVLFLKDDYLEKNKKYIRKIDATDDFSRIKDCDIVIVAVPTPIDENFVPNLKPLINASRSISKHLKEGQLVIIESTIHPGTVEEIVKPILEESGLIGGADFFLAHCPERIDPGNKKWTVENIPRVVGALTIKGTKKTAEFYKSIIKADITELNSVKAAEAVKIMENAFRDINIAFMNELAISFDKLGIDITEVIKGAATKPFAFMPHYPGCGVGGHCIPVDPYYLISKVRSSGHNPKFLRLARVINNVMPRYAVDLLKHHLIKAGNGLKGANVGVLGLAYKGDIDDIRESPAIKVISELKKQGAHVFVYDPYVKEGINTRSLNELLIRSDYLILVTAHEEFIRMPIKKLKENKIKVVIDGRNCLSKEGIESLGIIYKGIGR